MSKLDSLETFTLRRQHDINALNITVYEYAHNETGALHYHLAADNDENVCLIGFRTVPTDSSGVAHILEHTALCGSKHYPVRDPFFMMLRRSLNTFMNAFTSSDWTAYPFASQNEKDFFNLLDVYLDATFFSRLSELDFRQEGHRIEFKDNSDINSDLQYKGVVFNEMKGAMSSPVSTLWQKLTAHLYPTTTYHYNSGGEPEDIINLSYEDLMAFYKKHYHPSNAIFMTFGNLPVARLQEQFESKVLSKFSKQANLITINDEQRFTAPKITEEFYGYDEDPKEKTHIVIGWLLGHSSDAQSMLKAQLLSYVLLDNSACPLMHALETTDLANAPSPLCGLEDSNREMVFVCGVEGSEAEHSEAIEKLILSTLEKVSREGVPLEKVEAMLHQLELQQREIGGGSYPYGLQLILEALPAAVHRGDPLSVLDIDPILTQLRKDIQDPNTIKNLVKTMLLDNPHRVRLTMRPDQSLNQQKADAENLRLQKIKEKLSDKEKQKIIEEAHALKVRQETKDDLSILPKVTIADIPASVSYATGTTKKSGQHPVHCYSQATNGLIYQDIVIPLPKLTDELTAILPYFSSCIGEVGVGDLDYLATQELQAKISGGLDANVSLRSNIDSEQSLKAYFVISGKALQRNSQALTELLQKTLKSVRFDELPRIRELMSQIRAAREQSITGSGHSLAMQAATSGMSPTAHLSHRLHGLLGIKQLKTLDDSLDNGRQIRHFVEKLQHLHETLIAAPKELLLICEEASMQANHEFINAIWQHNSDAVSLNHFDLPKIRQSAKQIWTTSTQVNFSAKAYPTVPSQHADAAALTILGGFMRNGFLHTAIREKGGAYGGGASQDSDSASFRFHSYRDPRLQETLDDFDRAIDWVLQSKHDFEQVEEAILGVISSMDKPSSPAGEAKKTFYNNCFGRTPQQRQAFREQILSVTLADLQRVTELYLKPESASIGIITNQSTLEKIGPMGCDVYRL